MGKWEIISYISPLTYYPDLARGSAGNASHFSLTVDILALFGFGVLFFHSGHKMAQEKFE